MYFLSRLKLNILSNSLYSRFNIVIIIYNISWYIFNLSSTFILILGSLCDGIWILNGIRLNVILRLKCFNNLINSWLKNYSLSSWFYYLVSNNSWWISYSFSNNFWLLHNLFCYNFRFSHNNFFFNRCIVSWRNLLQLKIEINLSILSVS